MFQRLLPSSTLLTITRRSTKHLKGSMTVLSSTVSPAFTILPSSRYYSSIPKDEEDKEKERVSMLSEKQKATELKELDKKIAHLNTLRGINTGELYTFRGKFKALSRDYGMAFMAWYWSMWMASFGVTYTAIDAGLIDAMSLLSQFDNLTGFDMSSKIDPTVGTIGVAAVLNECLEPLRLPFVVVTVKPLVDTFYKND
jgi:hypothetical protein